MIIPTFRNRGYHEGVILISKQPPTAVNSPFGVAGVWTAEGNWLIVVVYLSRYFHEQDV